MDATGFRGATVADMATFIYQAASELARSREALRRRDPGALRVSVLALRDASSAAGADRMLALCGTLRTLVDGKMDGLETILDAIADEFDLVTSELQTVRSA